jgi:uncharacterized membrane protein
VSARRIIVILAVCLLVSVSLNLFAAGAFVALRSLDRSFGLGALMQTYPPSVRREVRQRVIADRATMRAVIADLRDARKRMFETMRAEPLDPDALARAMADVRAKTTALQAFFQSALAASLEKTPAAERRKIEPPGLGLGPFQGNEKE